MATLTKVISGEMYSENIIIPGLLWELTPNDSSRVNVTSDGTVLKHGDGRIAMLTTAPPDDYVFQVKIDHKPTTLSDIGGILIMCDNNNQIECQTYYNVTENAGQYYSYLKVAKERDLYTFYGSKDSIKWDVLGASILPDSHKIGFFLDGGKNTLTKDLLIQQVCLYKSNAVTFTNLPVGGKLEISRQDGSIVTQVTADGTQNKVLVSVANLMLPLEHCRIKVYDNIGILVSEILDTAINGGDIYDYKFNLQVLLDNTIINPAEVHSLGHINAFGNEYVLEIQNKDTSILSNKKIKILEYSEYFRGSKFAKLALKASDGSFGAWSDIVDIPPMLPNQIIAIKMRVDRDYSADAPFFVREYKYKVVIE